MPRKPPTKRQRQAETTRARIFEVAGALISERGFENVTVDQICAEAGVAKGGFYHHFSSKDDIIIETYREIDDAFLTAMASLPRDAGPRQRILFTTGFMAQMARDRGAAYCRQIYRSQMERGTSFFVSPERPFYATLAGAVGEGVRQGRFTGDASGAEAAHLILTLARGVIYDWSMMGGSYDILEFMRRAVSSLLDGLLDHPKLS